ncbi:MAG: hypothetical protein IH978_08385 [Nitrospinae bacterium]|nr:hypothetical protein [Nitrospinota bacterium]
MQFCFRKIESELGQAHFLAFKRYVIDEQPVTEVCRESGLTPGRLYKIKWRVTRRMREIMKEHLGSDELLDELEEAEESFVEGLARDATVPQLWVQRALVSQQQGKFGEALEGLRQAELIAPKLPEVQLNLAYSLEVQGHIKNAVEHYHSFLALTEGNPAYYPARRKVLERVIRLEKT